jgi:hypothetical protein
MTAAAWAKAAESGVRITSERKRRANRENARASTGPRSRAGKARASRNARRHGLSIPIWFDKTVSRDAEQLAGRIVDTGVKASPQLWRQARRLAEAILEVVRVDKMHRSLIESMLTSDGGYWPRKKKNVPRMGGAVIRKRSQRLLRMLWGPHPTVELVDLVLSDSTRQFKALDRYQRRALSRLKRAIEDFDTLRILESIEARSRFQPKIIAWQNEAKLQDRRPPGGAATKAAPEKGLVRARPRRAALSNVLDRD